MSVVSIWRQTSFWAVVAQRYKISLNILCMNGNKQVGHIIVHVLKWVCPAFLCVSATVSHDATVHREAFNSTVFFTRCSICGPRGFTAQQYSPFTYGDKKTLGYFTASVLPHRLILLLLGFFLILIFFFLSLSLSLFFESGIRHNKRRLTEFNTDPMTSHSGS